MNPGGGRGVLIAGILVHVLFLASLKTQFLNPLFAEARQSYGQAADYFGIYAAGENLVHGRSIYETNADARGATQAVPYSYFFRYLPPTAYVAALSTLVVRPWTGYLLWILTTEALLLLVVRSILRVRSVPLTERRTHAGLWLGFFPFYLEQWMGQFSFLMAFFLWVLLRRTVTDPSSNKGDAPPGKTQLLAWASSISLKSYTALFAVSYLRRRWIRPVACGAALVILLCAPYYLARPQDAGAFLRLNFGGLPAKIHTGALGLSAFVRQLGWCLPADIAGRRLVVGPLDVYVQNVPVVAMDILILAAAAWIVFRHGCRCSMTLQLSLWVLAFFLVFKDVWEYHYVMLLPVLTALSFRYRSALIPWLGLMFAIPTPYALVVDANGSLSELGGLIQHASKAVPCFLLFLWVIATARREARAGVENRGAASPAAAR